VKDNSVIKYFVFTILAVVFVVTGCQGGQKEVDPEKLNLVDHYVEDLTKALLDAEPDLLGWVREPYSENLPLKYDNDRLALLDEHKQKIEAIRERRQGVEFPTEDEIADWQVIVVRGDDEWLLEGSSVLEALLELDTLSDRFTAAVELIADNEGVMTMTQSELIITLTEELLPAVETIRAVLYR